MNNKGQFGFVRVIFFSVIFLILFSLALAPIVTTALGISQVDGFPGWILSKTNVWIIIGFVMFLFAALVYGMITQ